MSHAEISNYYTHEPKQGAPDSIVLLLHGLGANGRDLIGLAPVMAAALPQTVFVSPDAPYQCDMAPTGFQWFSLQEWTAESILRGVKRAAPTLDYFITDQLKKHRLPASKLALLGFSQGTMMSLHVGPRYKDAIAGVVGYSGALIEVPDENAHRVPVCLVHGEADNVVPIDAYLHAKQGLESAGFKVSGHSTPGLLHGIDDVGVKAGTEFLKTILA